MTSAVDGLKQRFMAMSQPDADGVYRDGAAKRKARTDLAMACLKQLWQEALDAVSFEVPAAWFDRVPTLLWWPFMNRTP